MAMRDAIAVAEDLGAARAARELYEQRVRLRLIERDLEHERQVDQLIHDLTQQLDTMLARCANRIEHGTRAT